MSLIQSREAQLIKQFEAFSTWEDKYKYIIQLGRALPPLPQDKYTEDLKIKGCQSQVWLWAEPDAQNNIQIMADSDALITKGLVAIVVSLYSGSSPREIAEHSLEVFKKLGLFDHLSPSRANGFSNMIKQVKNYALAYLMLEKRASD